MNALKTKKLILLVYDILLIVGGGLMLIPIKKAAESRFDSHEEQSMYMSVYVFLILNSIILIYNIITFYSRKYPYLPDFKFGYEAFFGAHIFTIDILYEANSIKQLENYSYIKILYLFIYFIIIAGNYFFEKIFIEAQQEINSNKIDYLLGENQKEEQKELLFNIFHCCSLVVLKFSLFIFDIGVGIACVFFVVISYLLMTLRGSDLSLITNSIFLICVFSLLILLINVLIFLLTKYRSESMCYFRFGHYIVSVFFFSFKFMLLSIPFGFLMLCPSTVLVVFYFLLEENYIQRMKQIEKKEKAISNQDNIIGQIVDNTNIN